MLMKPDSKGKNPSPQPSGISDEALTSEKVWLMFQKTDKKLNNLEYLFTSQWENWSNPWWREISSPS